MIGSTIAKECAYPNQIHVYEKDSYNAWEKVTTLDMQLTYDTNVNYDYYNAEWSQYQIYDDTIVVGYPYTSSSSSFNMGSLVTYFRDNDEWVQSSFLYIPGYDSGSASLSNLGNSVSIYEDVIAAGANNDNVGNGAVYIFQGGYSTGVWTNTQILHGQYADSKFGTDVELHKTHLIISSPYDNDGYSYNTYTPAIYVYTQQNTSIWLFTQKLLSTVTSYGDVQPLHMTVYDNNVAVQWTIDTVLELYTISEFSRYLAGNWFLPSTLQDAVIKFGNNKTIYVTNSDSNTGSVFVYTQSIYDNVFIYDYDISLHSGYVNNFGTSLAVDGDILLVEYVTTTYYNGYYGSDFDDYYDYNNIAVREYSISESDSSSTSNNGESSIGAIVGGITGIIAMVLIVFVVKYYITGKFKFLTSNGSNVSQNTTCANVEYLTHYPHEGGIGMVSPLQTHANRSTTSDYTEYPSFTNGDGHYADYAARLPTAYSTTPYHAEAAGSDMQVNYSAGLPPAYFTTEYPIEVSAGDVQVKYADGLPSPYSTTECPSQIAEIAAADEQDYAAGLPHLHSATENPITTNSEMYNNTEPMSYGDRLSLPFESISYTVTNDVKITDNNSV
jgi:hypothetical protein